MYCISDKQIEFILNDISARGVKMDSLQQDILDHVCCIIEQNLEENGDFEAFYTKIIKEFYKDELKEIEEETLSLLNNKHLYTMKKVMINSGIFSASALSLGIVFKFLHLPGASVCIVLGIFFLSFVFLPLMFTLKIKEQQKSKDKVLIGLGTLSAILMTLSVLFRIQHWPGAMVMGYLTIGILILVFLPVYLISGIRQADTKVNTIVSSVLLVAGCGLWLTLVITPAGVRLNSIKDTASYVRSEQLLENEKRQTEKQLRKDTVNEASIALSNKINDSCEGLKALIIRYAGGYKVIDTNFESKDELLSNVPFYLANSVYCRLVNLKKLVDEYNETGSKQANPAMQSIPVKATVLDMTMQVDNRVVDALNDIIRIQMFLLQNERTLTCMK